MDKWHQNPITLQTVRATGWDITFYKIMRVVPLMLLVCICNGCTYSKIVINSDEYCALPKISCNDISPSAGNVCWALVENGMAGWDSILYASEPCEPAFRNVKRKFVVGFDETGLPVPSYKYIVTYDQEKATYWSTADSVRLFLGEINNISEALLLASANDYSANGESAWKTEADGYSLILFKLVKKRFPVQVDKFLLKVAKDGHIQINGREVYNRIDKGVF